MSASQKRQVEALLEDCGWRVSSRDVAPGEWWVDERWVLESNWSPRGAVAHASFLVDPQAVTDRRPGEHVWAVAVTRQRPSERLEATPVVPLRPHWERRNLDELRRHIEALREERSSSAGEQ
jgi:hypothetical protein